MQILVKGKVGQPRFPNFGVGGNFFCPVTQQVTFSVTFY